MLKKHNRLLRKLEKCNEFTYELYADIETTRTVTDVECILHIYNKGISFNKKYLLLSYRSKDLYGTPLMKYGRDKLKEIANWTDEYIEDLILDKIYKELGMTEDIKEIRELLEKINRKGKVKIKKEKEKIC